MNTTQAELFKVSAEPVSQIVVLVIHQLIAFFKNRM